LYPAGAVYAIVVAQKFVVTDAKLSHIEVIGYIVQDIQVQATP